MPRPLVIAALFCAGLGSLDSAAFAQAPASEARPDPPVRFEAGMGGWLSTGRTTWSHNASGVEPTVGNPSSRLQYRDVAVNFLEFTGTLTARERVFIRAAFGVAEIGGGRLTDDDFVSDQGATFYNTSTPGAQRISRTISDLKGDSNWYALFEGGARLWTLPRHRGFVNGFAGYRYWYQRHVATGVGQVECTSLSFCDPVGTVSAQRQNVITNRQTWHSVELGLDGEVWLLRRLRLYGKAAFLPFNRFSNEDAHLLRSDLLKDPSFRLTGWGLGANVEAGFSVRVWSRLFVDLGYRFWWNQALDGTWENFPIGGGGVSVPVTEFRTTRHGATVGVRYQF